YPVSLSSHDRTECRISRDGDRGLARLPESSGGGRGLKEDGLQEHEAMMKTTALALCGMLSGALAQSLDRPRVHEFSRQPLRQYEIVRVRRLLRSPEHYDGWRINQRSPAVGDVG